MTQAPEPSSTAGVGAARFVPMRRRHLRGVMRIETTTRPRPWSMGLFLSELSLESRSYFVARVGGEVVGFAGLMTIGDDAHVTTIAVDPAWQRHKLGTCLMLVLVREALKRDCRNLTLEVRMKNDAAQELYRRFGFTPGGIRKNYYADIGEDALIMWANDIDSAEYADRLATIEAGIPRPTSLEGVES